VTASEYGRPAAALQAPFPVFSDAQGTVTAAYRLSQTGAATCVVLSPNLQVLTILPVHDVAVTVPQVLATLATDLPPIAPLAIYTQAPVLLIPGGPAHPITPSSRSGKRTATRTGVEHSHHASGRTGLTMPEVPAGPWVSDP
jgi:hypothetical protein